MAVEEALKATERIFEEAANNLNEFESGPETEFNRYYQDFKPIR
jgi:hypothetical protein